MTWPCKKYLAYDQYFWGTNEIKNTRQKLIQHTLDKNFKLCMAQTNIQKDRQANFKTSDFKSINNGTIGKTKPSQRKKNVY